MRISTMPWVKLDDGFYDNPKILAAGLAATGLYVMALSYCGRHLTDGFVPAKFVRGAKAAAQRLVALKLWLAIEGGFRIPDYLEFNPSRMAVLAARSRERARKSGRIPSGLRADSERIPGGLPGTPTRSDPSHPEDTEKTSTSAVGRASAPPAIRLDATGFVVQGGLLSRWESAYPAVDVPAEVKRAFEWAQDNPSNRKSNWRRFLGNWLRRAQDRAPARGNGDSPSRGAPSVVQTQKLLDRLQGKP